MYRLMYFVKFGMLPVIIFSNISFGLFLSLFSVWLFHYAYVGTFDGIPQVSETLFIFIHLFFFSILQDNPS